MNKIEVNTPTRTLTVSWTDMERFKKYLFLQRSMFSPPGSGNRHRLPFERVDDLVQNINIFYQKYWNLLQNFKVYDDLPDNPTIVDVGSGMGTVDFLAYQYLNNTGKFYLVDHDDYRPPGPTYSEKYDHYHSWDVSKDIIATSNFDPDAFVFVDRTDWPSNIDLVTSWASWCWHYPRSTYWAQVQNNLKIGGKLVLEVSQHPVRLESAEETAQELIDAISDEFQSTPIIFPMKPDGLRVQWIRNR